MFGINLFATPLALLQGLILGIIFGFLLQKGRVSRFGVIVGQFLLTDFAVAKIMLTAIIVGGAGMYGMLYFVLIPGLLLKTPPTILAGIGGAVFGVGMAILGYCPGTGLAAIGDGAKDAWFGLAGMIAGAGIFERFYPWISAQAKGLNMGDLTLPALTGLSEWMVLFILAVIAGAVFWFLERGGK